MSTTLSLEAQPWFDRRRALLALGALAGCGGGSGGDDAGALPAETRATSLAFADAHTAYAVGTAGFVVRSDDGGRRWRRLQAGTGADLISVHAVDAQLAFVSSIDFEVLRTRDGGASWQRLQPRATSAIVHGPVVLAPSAEQVVLRVEPNLRWGVSEHLWATRDGGLHWAAVQAPFQPWPAPVQLGAGSSLFCLDRWTVAAPPWPLWLSDDLGVSFRRTGLSGVAAGALRRQGLWLQLGDGASATAPPVLATSRDGFRTWTETSMDLPAAGDGAALPVHVAWVDGDGGAWATAPAGLLHSDDGGQRWRLVGAPGGIDPRIGYALDGQGWAAQIDGKVSAFTTDAGLTWRTLAAPQAPASMVELQRDHAGGLLARSGSLSGFAWQRSLDNGRTWLDLIGRSA